MVVSGTLAVKVHRLDGDEDKSNNQYRIRLTVGGYDRSTSKGAGFGQTIDESLNFKLHKIAESEEVTIEVLQGQQKKPLVSDKWALQEFMKGFHDRSLSFKSGSSGDVKNMHLKLSAEWTPTDQKSTSLTSSGTHRPWFMRASYYYDTTKNVYDYTTSFRIVKPFARLGEATVNTVLATVSGKTLYDVDQSLVVPVLNSVDNKVDATISVAFTKLYEGQQLAVRTKNKAVHAVSSVASKTGNTAVRATKYTTNKVAYASGSVLGVVSGVADYTSSQVVHASSSTYGLVRGVTYFFVSHIPILGPKIRA